MRMVWEPMTRQSLDGCKNDNDGDGHGDGSRADRGVRDNVSSIFTVCSFSGHLE